MLDLSLVVESLMGVEMASRIGCADGASERRGGDGQVREPHDLRCCSWTDGLCQGATVREVEAERYL